MESVDLNPQTQAQGFRGVAALLGWVAILIAAVLFRRAGHGNTAGIVGIAGDAAVAALCVWVLRRNRYPMAGRENDMDPTLFSAVLLLSLLSLPAWLLFVFHW
jgi:hypothetical protein